MPVFVSTIAALDSFVLHVHSSLNGRGHLSMQLGFRSFLSSNQFVVQVDGSRPSIQSTMDGSAAKEIDDIKCAIPTRIHFTICISEVLFDFFMCPGRRTSNIRNAADADMLNCFRDK